MEPARRLGTTCGESGLNVLVTGGGGMLGTMVAETLRNRSHQVFTYSHRELDVLDEEAVGHAVSKAKIYAVIHCAAFTDVDGSESQPEKAFSVNVIGSKNVANACAKAGAFMVYVSSDYVFDGTKGAPYDETDSARPLGIYGLSKLGGELAVAAEATESFIVRTSWLYGPHGRNFVDAIIARAKSGQPLKVVDDQVGSPTYTGDLAAGIADLLENGATPGIYHMANGGYCSWRELAIESLKLAGLAMDVASTTTAELGRPAPRPAFSALDTLRDLKLRDWRQGLARYVKNRRQGEEDD